MATIRKVTPDANDPNACIPGQGMRCIPLSVETCSPSALVSDLARLCIPHRFCIPHFPFQKRTVSGMYKSPAPDSGRRIDLRVDIDGRRPQNMISGDFFNCGKLCGVPICIYDSSFVVETIATTWASDKVTVTGQVKYYSSPGINTHWIEVEIPLVSMFSPAPAATAKFYIGTSLDRTFNCPKVSGYFRQVDLEIDRLTGTAFPPDVNTNIDPHPADLTEETITCTECYRRAGVDITLDNDEILTDSDSADAGTTWNYGELHDLMETRFTHFANIHQWNVYGLIVDRMSGNVSGTGYNSGLYGVMFDFGAWQAGDTHLRQGCAIAYDALMGRVSGTLYNTAAKRNRLFLETFVHEVGHNFNLPHTWQRTDNPDSASNSFMNYPWGYTGGAGTETAFWSDFRWEFDDDEIAWMRHGNRPDVIFGGNDWIGNNLSMFPGEDAGARSELGVRLEVRSVPVFDFAEPVEVELKLKNIASHAIDIPTLLRPEDGLVTIFVKRPDGIFFRFVAPMHCEQSFDQATTVQPGASLYERVPLSVGAKGQHFAQPGEYYIKAYGMIPGKGMAVSRAQRFRVAAPFSRESEELAYRLFDYRAAKILYFEGSRRYPETMSALEEASSRYAKTDPRTVRHIHAALGMFYRSDFKTLEKTGDAWKVKTAKADTRKALQHLGAARTLPKRGVKSPLGNIGYNRVSSSLVDLQIELDKKEDAAAVLKESIAYFEKQGVIKSVIQGYKSRLAGLQKK
jgi:hypothetical protein